MGILYSTLATCLILITLCNAAVEPLKPFTKFCKVKNVKNGTYDSDCERLLRHIYLNYIAKSEQYWYPILSLAAKLDAIEDKLVRDGCGEEDATDNTVCMVHKSLFDKSQIVYPMKPNDDNDLQKGIEETIKFLRAHPNDRSASFIIGPSASGKSSITSTIAAGINSMPGVRNPIFTVDGDDFREGYRPYQQLIRMSRNFPCSLEKPNARCVFDFYAMPKFESLKQKYIQKLWERAKKYRAHLIVPETPKMSRSTIYKNVKYKSFGYRAGSYIPIVYKIEVTEKDQKFIMKKGTERGKLSGKEYKKPDWDIITSLSRKPRLWPNTWTLPGYALINGYNSKFIKLKYKPKPETDDQPVGISNAVPDETIENIIDQHAISDDMPGAFVYEDTMYYDFPILDDGIDLRKH